MYLPGTWARLISGFETTLGHSGHFCSVYNPPKIKDGKMAGPCPSLRFIVDLVVGGGGGGGMGV